MLKIVDRYYKEILKSIEKSENEKLVKALETLDELGSKPREFVLKNVIHEFTELAIMSVIDEDSYIDMLADAIVTFGNEMKEVSRKYVFKIQLDGLSKHIQRTICVPRSTSLAVFGTVIAMAFQADCSHLFGFFIDRKSYVLNPDDDFMEEYSVFETKLMDLNLNEKSKMKYCYDFGEGYTFTIKFVKEVNDPGNQAFEILKGKGYGIWEDHHYYLDAYYDDPKTLVETWEGDMIPVEDLLNFDPDECEIDELNEMIHDGFELCFKYYIEMVQKL